ncbi:MAG: hypothetical protein ACRYHQ_26165 [Janthinobacterium lividum]
MTDHEAARLVWMVSEVRRCLDACLGTGRYTAGFVAELTQRFAGRGYNLHEVFDEIGILEGTNPRPSRTAPAAELASPLQGFWHKQHQQVLFRDVAPCSSFFVFRRLADGSNAYLALGSHEDWEAVAARIGAYRRRADAGDQGSKPG